MKASKIFEQVFMSAPQLNPSNSGKGKGGNYVCAYNKTKRAKDGIKDE